MKNFIYLFVFSVFSFSVVAQEVPDLPMPEENFAVNTSVPQTVPASVPIVSPAPEITETEVNNPQASEKASVFDDMMDTLFGASSLPEPQGSLSGEVSEPAPLFSEIAEVPPTLPVDAMQPDIAPPPVAFVPPPPPVQAIIPPPPMPARPVVGNFDIAGIKLKMNPKDVFKQALEHGYSPVYVDKIPANFVKWRLERQCMDEGVYIHERKQECIKENAKKTGDYYINYMEFSKEDSREKIRAFFTSSFSGNKLYRVTYYNEGDNSLGDSGPSIYIKDKRKTEFYNWVFKKYGQPTNPGSMMWGDGGNSPYFQAWTSGASVNFNLTLEDPVMPYDDAQAMKKSDVKSVTYSKFSF